MFPPDIEVSNDYYELSCVRIVNPDTDAVDIGFLNPVTVNATYVSADISTDTAFYTVST